MALNGLTVRGTGDLKLTQTGSWVNLKKYQPYHSGTLQVETDAAITVNKQNQITGITDSAGSNPDPVPQYSEAGTGAWH